MADPGFLIAETVSTYEARLEPPSFTKGKDQLRTFRFMIPLLHQTFLIDFLITEKDKTNSILDKLVTLLVL